FQAEDGIRDDLVTGVQTCALPIWARSRRDMANQSRRLPKRCRRKESCPASKSSCEAPPLFQEPLTPPASRPWLLEQPLPAPPGQIGRASCRETLEIRGDARAG